tara:strand:- start:75 stop:1064 length:990 start_codon:yes stop_codon:yes gene_type:complete
MLPTVPDINRLPFVNKSINAAGISILSLAPNASMWGVRDMTGGSNPLVMDVERVPQPSGQATTRSFYANEVENGTLLSWVTESSPTANGFVTRLYDQNSTRDFDYYKEPNLVAPKIVVNGALSTDTEGKVAINGNGALLRLGPTSSTNNANFFSSDGTWSLFLVTDFPDYSGATNNNVQIIHYETPDNGGANGPRKPVIACNKNFNQLAVGQPTQTVGSGSVGNIFLPTYPGEQLFSNFGNPALATNNNEAFLDAAGRGDVGYGTTNLSTSVNTNTTASSSLNRIFMSSETGVTSYISALVYAPSYLYPIKTDIENELVRLYNITFVDE